LWLKERIRRLRKEFGKGEKDMSTFEKNVLLVDDEAIFCEAVQDYLTFTGCNVMVAENGLRAYEQIRAKRFDLVLMDINMSKMDGIETIKAVRELKV
jgi:CheY-like chemotaxis protein